MYTTINGVDDNVHIILEEAPSTKKSMKVSKQGFSERWQGQFKLNDKTGDERFDYLKQRYQL